MRRFLILLLMLGWGGVVLCWALPMTARGANVPDGTEAEKAPLVFPCPVAGTPLEAVGLGLYEGLFLEDGSDSPKADTAALLVKNTSDTPIAKGGVILRVGDEILTFFIYALPPGESAYVQEAGGKPFPGCHPDSCSGWAETALWPDPAGVLSVVESGMGELTVTNLTDSTFAAVRLLYKGYDPGSGVYLGGICYETEAFSLPPGQSRRICPHHYARGYSRVVAVLFSEGKNAAEP